VGPEHGLLPPAGLIDTGKQVRAEEPAALTKRRGPQNRKGDGLA